MFRVWVVAKTNQTTLCIIAQTHTHDTHTTTLGPELTF